MRDSLLFFSAFFSIVLAEKCMATAGGGKGSSYGHWQQCGGKSNCPNGVSCDDKPWGKCADGLECKRQSDYYWQCLSSSENHRQNEQPSQPQETPPETRSEDVPVQEATGEQVTEEANGGGGGAPVIPSGDYLKGVTTRYWDCCKPSCSWPDKAKYKNNRPVATCEKDGFNKLNLASNAIYEQSGCTSGNAWGCNDQKPIVIDDNLSYGFAAAKLKGKGEGDWCCACYELKFTTQIPGKRMIVQVTNTGGDLGDNHFDLAIPGGGMGIFSGCAKQYGNHPFGAQYGGVNSLNECDGLPEPMQEGCRWRFGWFKGSNNPEVEFKEVACPAQLTAITGCERA